MGSVKLVHPVETFGTSSTLPVEAIPKHRERFEVIVAIVERLADLIAVLAAEVSAYGIYKILRIGRHLHYSGASAVSSYIGFAALFVLLLDHDGAYKQANSFLRIRETERILRVTTQAFAVIFSISFLYSQMFSRWVTLLAAILVPLLVISEKQLVFILVRQLHSRGYGLQNVLIYGGGLTGRRVFSALLHSPKLGMNPIAIVDDDKNLAGNRIYEYGYTRKRWAPVIEGPLSRDLIAELTVSLVVVGIPSLPQDRLKELAEEAFAAGATLAFVPQLTCGSESPTRYVDIDGLLIASMDLSKPKRLYEVTKRAGDFILALLLMVFTLPLWGVLAALICLDSKGPALFSQLRVGRQNRVFKLYKFRTMRLDAPKYGIHPTTSDDPRITRLGRWLRRSSLDELPQLINVLKGEMSLVGPRPEMPFIVETYNLNQRQRLQVTPGLTGLWQLSADRSLLIHENIQYDLYYIRHRNFFMDLAILLHTVAFAMKGM